MDMSDIIYKAIEMLGVDDVDKGEVKDFLEEAVFYVELTAMAAAGLEKLYEVFKSDDLSPVERTKLIAEHRAELEKMRNRLAG